MDLNRCTLDGLNKLLVRPMQTIRAYDRCLDWIFGEHGVRPTHGSTLRLGFVIRTDKQLGNRHIVDGSCILYHDKPLNRVKINGERVSIIGYEDVAMILGKEAPTKLEEKLFDDGVSQVHPTTSTTPNPFVIKPESRESTAKFDMFTMKYGNWAFPMKGADGSEAKPVMLTVNSKGHLLSFYTDNIKSINSMDLGENLNPVFHKCLYVNYSELNAFAEQYAWFQHQFVFEARGISSKRPMAVVVLIRHGITEKELQRATKL